VVFSTNRWWPGCERGGWLQGAIQTLARGQDHPTAAHPDVVERVCDRVIIIDKGRCWWTDGRMNWWPHEVGSRAIVHPLTGGAELERRAEDFAKTFRS
jgi:ABC-2 type transport system ATP-binding protein